MKNSSRVVAALLLGMQVGFVSAQSPHPAVSEEATFVFLGRSVAFTISHQCPQVDVCGDLAVASHVGADGLGMGTGSAFLFQRTPGRGAWDLLRTIVPREQAAGELFGHAVALDRDTLVVTSKVFPVSANSPPAPAHVFERDSGGPDNWGEAQTVLPGEDDALVSFGASVAIEMDTMVVGAPPTQLFSSQTGSAYVYERDAGGLGNWGQARKLDPGDDPAGRFFGQSVAIDGDFIVVGASGVGFVWGGPEGGAYVFDRNAGGRNNWGIVKKLTVPGIQSVDSFGRSVAISGNTVAVGAPGKTSPGFALGAVYVFVRHEGGKDGWGLTSTIMTRADSEGDQSAFFGDRFGSSVSLDKDWLAANASNKSDHPPGRGSIYLFRRGNAKVWSQVTRLWPSEGENWTEFGRSVSLDGHCLITGAAQMPVDETVSRSVFLLRSFPGAQPLE